METTTKPVDGFFQDLRKRCNFYFATNDSRTVTQLLYGISELTNDIHFYINTKGVTFGQSLHRNNMMIYGILHAPKFDYFFSDVTLQKTEHVIFFTVNHLYKVFSQGAPGDLLVVAQEKNKEEKLLIYLFSKGEENQIREYEITLMVPITEERYEANVSQVSYILGLSTAEFTKYINCFHTLDAEFHPRTLLQISCSEQAFEMRIKGNLTIETAGVKVLKKKPEDKEGLTIEKQKKKQIAASSSSSSSSSTPVVPDEVQEATKCIDTRINEVARPEYRGAFRLRHLASVQKCLNQNKGMLRLWLSNDQPMVAEVDIGGLGVQRITFMFSSPDDDDFEDEELNAIIFLIWKGKRSAEEAKNCKNS